MSKALRISRSTALLFAFLSVWLLGGLGFGIALHFTGPWYFVATNKPSLAMQIGVLYVVRAASMLPAVCIASILIGSSHFKHPYYVVIGMVAGVTLLGLLFRWIVRWPAWESFASSASAIALTFELLSVVVLAGMGALFVLFILWRRSHEVTTKG